MVDEVEQAVVGPVEILEHEYERPLLCRSLEQPTPRGERLLALGALRSFEPDERARMP